MLNEENFPHSLQISNSPVYTLHQNIIIHVISTCYFPFPTMTCLLTSFWIRNNTIFFDTLTLKVDGTIGTKTGCLRSSTRQNFVSLLRQRERENGRAEILFCENSAEKNVNENLCTQFRFFFGAKAAASSASVVWPN